ncbi:type VI secretion system baseplate subunit TssG [Psychrosphaera sp. B3R10]|uniref:type VI secretion system baseplate subunit TssG n=1 Tax=unclassified Psychrosphaera TaxID=2641570 RepID=UPI001C07FB3F|nr:type VI secretion system baseplate subunit TssG [Psychrosphaera sp. I2R16]MBU2987907.1 type VI secretion system baseplate subunit TssG [Psychrosphaera sp. B3R10]
MASTIRQTSPSVEERILTSPKTFTFERLLTNLYAIVKASGEDPLKKIRVRPALSMQISRSEIVSVTKNSYGEFEVVTNILGLYGSSSPLPSFYTEELLQFEQEEQTTARQFLDIVHQRLYQLFALAQKKYNAVSQVVEFQKRDFSQLLHHLIGTSDISLQQKLITPDMLLKFSGLLASKQRSAQGLKSLLETYLAELKVDVSVEQYVERQVIVPLQHLSSLGVNSCELGCSALVGDKVIDNSSKIIIHLGPLSQGTFEQLVNNKNRWQAFIALVKTYIDRPLEVDIKIGLITKAAKGIRLGEKQWGQLGYDTWLLQEQNHTDGKKDGVEDVLVTTLNLL